MCRREHPFLGNSKYWFNIIFIIADLQYVRYHEIIAFASYRGCKRDFLF